MIYFAETILAILVTHSYWALITAIFIWSLTYMGRKLYQWVKEEWI